MTSARLDVLFGDMKSWLPDLLANVVEKQAQRSFIPRRAPSRRQPSVSWAWKS
ncbi:peptidase M32 carboxypeptidase Taq metallopeptidase [Enterobacter asburiae]|uniref:Peptidase M32 carboxypeptidase Taq metallopeptidase n=1 Tax=Enterobacter asburiae TaxID=61645 RepID=A0A376F7V8_ENTAS|nr:peptidase M32 carboxypeptidase Taq metallopeptidase [Enterobacter asburiae]